MELRSAKRKDYKTSLISLGLYEDGMKLEEMKQMMQALEESQLECETVFFDSDSDMERALKESELDYVQMRCDAHSSTMIRQASDNNLNIIKPLAHCSRTPVQYLQNTDASPFSSPEIASEKIVVEAIVHHDLNWSPPPLKREFHICSSQKCLHNSCNIEKRKIVENESDVCNIKRSRPLITSLTALLTEDLGTSSEYEPENQNQVNDEYYSDPSF